MIEKMKLLKNILKKNKFDVAIESLQKLGNRLIHGISSESDLPSWESNLLFADERIQHRFNDLFLKYLLKHYPKDERLKQIYSNDDDIYNARNALYKEMLLMTIGDALYMLKYQQRDFDLLEVGRHEKLINEIEEYIFFENKNRELFYIKENNNPDWLTEINLVDILKDIQKYMPCKTQEQYNWYIRAKNIGSFKYLEHDTESIFRKRQKLDLKHGILLGDVGSGKTKAVQKEIKLILENTNDDIVIIDNDGLYEEFCHKNNGKYINMTKDNTFYDNGTPTINNRLIVLDIHNLNDEIKLQYASKALKYAYQKMNGQSESSKDTWLYIEEVNDLVFDDYFLNILMHCRRKNGVITIVTNRVMDIIENNNSSRLFSNCSYIRLFRQSPMYRKNLAKFFSIPSELLEFDDIKTSWVIMVDEFIKIKEKLV